MQFRQIQFPRSCPAAWCWSSRCWPLALTWPQGEFGSTGCSQGWVCVWLCQFHWLWDSKYQVTLETMNQGVSGAVVGDTCPAPLQGCLGAGQWTGLHLSRKLLPSPAWCPCVCEMWPNPASSWIPVRGTLWLSEEARNIRKRRQGNTKSC